jgi:hypothetical protein
MDFFKLENWTNSEEMSKGKATMMLFGTARVPDSIEGWLAFSIVTSIGGTSLLVLLLTTSLKQKRLREGSRILIIHLMFIQVLLCGIYFPILYITSYTAIMETPERIRLQTAAGSTEQCVARPQLGVVDVGRQQIRRHFASASLPAVDFGENVADYVAFTVVDRYRGLTPRAFWYWWKFRLGATVRLRVQNVQQECIWHNLGDSWSLHPDSVDGNCLRVTVSSSGHRSLSHKLRHSRFINRSKRAISRKSAATNRLRQIGMARMLVMSFLWHSLCFLPGPVIKTEYQFLYERNFMLRLWIVAINLCGFAASPVSPGHHSMRPMRTLLFHPQVIFLALSSDYQTGLNQMLRKLWAGVSLR